MPASPVLTGSDLSAGRDAAHQLGWYDAFMASTPSRTERRSEIRPARAEPSEGDRTTLRVPPDLISAADDFAEQYGVTRNAALIALARRGRDGLAADEQLRQLRGQIEQAVLGPPRGRTAAEFPTTSEWAEAILAPRGEDVPSP